MESDTDSLKFGRDAAIYKAIKVSDCVRSIEKRKTGYSDLFSANGTKIPYPCNIFHARVAKKDDTPKIFVLETRIQLWKPTTGVRALRKAVSSATEIRESTIIHYRRTMVWLSPVSMGKLKDFVSSEADN